MNQKMPRLVRAKSVRPLQGCVVRVEFEDGVMRDVNLEPYLRGPVFDPIRHNQDLFRSVSIVDGVLTWTNGADIDPDVLYYRLAPAHLAAEATATET